MKKCLLFLLAFAFLYSTAALAAPKLEMGPIYFQFSGAEQLSASGSITSPSESYNETSWGIFKVGGVYEGSTEDQEFGTDYNSIWTPGGGDSITGIFGGFEKDLENPGTFSSTGGQLWLYYNEASNPTLTVDPTERWNDDQDFTFPGFTQGELLLAVDYAPGVIDNDTTTITGSASPATGLDGTEGSALAYGNIKDVGGDGEITSSDDGAWAPYLNTAFFETYRENADLFFQNSYTEKSSWNGDASELFYGDDVFGANLSDPGRAYATPEPTTLLLFGTGLLGLAAFGRKKFMKKS